MGLDVYLYKDKQGIELPSTLYPEHLFKIGYWRSSYNDGGINNVLHNAKLPTLGEIVPEHEHDYEFVPDWPAALRRVVEAIAKFDQYTQQPIAQYAAMDIGHNIFGAPTVREASQAIEVFRGELEQHDTGNGSKFDAYSNGNGEFHLKGLECVGFVPGWDVLKSPCVYVIYKRPADSWQFYHQALEIVHETIEWVIATGEPQAYSLHWSS